MSDAFRLQYPHVKSVLERTFRVIKETPVLNDMMPSNLVWMEESVLGRRYFATPTKIAPVKVVTQELAQQADAFMKRASASIVRTIQHFSIDVDGTTLCVMPDKLNGGAEDNAFAPFIEWRVNQDMRYMFGDTSKSGRSKQLQTMAKFGYATPEGKVNFDRLRVSLDAFDQRIEEGLNAMHGELSNFAGRVDPENHPCSVDRNQYSMDPAIIARDIQVSTSDSSSF